jgi:hypothetical protein
MVARNQIRGNSVLAFPCLVGLSTDAFQCSGFVSFGRNEQYGRKHDISNHLVLAAQDTGWVELFPLGTVNSDVDHPDCGEYSESVLSSLPAPADALAVYRDVVFSYA